MRDRDARAGSADGSESVASLPAPPIVSDSVSSFFGLPLISVFGSSLR